jgi:hypothetical protein
MAELIDIEEQAAEENEEFTNITEAEQPRPPEQTKQPTEENVNNSNTKPTVPDKYQGKSVEELVEMHQNAEKALGKQGGEVGELRKIVDDYIAAQATPQPKETPTESEDYIDFFTAPEKAVERAIANHPTVKAAKEASEIMQMETARNHILAKYPTIQEDLQDPKFAEWVSSSPYRKKQFVQAEVNADLDAVDELMTGWNERKKFVGETVKTETDARKSSVKDASTGSTKSSQGGVRKPIYRRADIIKLIQTDPDRYEAMQDEIMQAYREKRVK